MNDCDRMVTLPLMNCCEYDFHVIYFICDSMPNGYVYCFNHLYNIWVLIYITGLVKSVFERSLSGKKSQFLSKSGFFYYLGIYLLQPGYILSANKLAPLPGNEWAYLPWENDRVEERFLWANRNFKQKIRLYICHGDSTVKLVQNLRSHSGFEKTYAR